MTSAKYLGVNFTSGLSWNHHVDEITSKANKCLGFLRRNLNISNCKAKETAYKSLVRPIVEYASPVWDPHTANNIDKIEMVQRRAARFVKNRYRQTSSVTSMLNELQWRSLRNRRADSKLTMFYKIVNDQVAVDPDLYIKPQVSTRSTRGSHNRSFQVPYSRQNCHLYSFFPSTVRLWNGLPQEVVSAPSVAAFHSRISNMTHF